MRYKKTPIIALIFSVALAALTMTLAFAQSGSSSDEKLDEKTTEESASVPSLAPATNGGPDAYGYTYADSNEASCGTMFNDISGVGTPLGLSDDGEVNVTVPFAITLYDVTTTTLRIGNNGALSLGATSGDVSASNEALPVASDAFADGAGVMPFWDDLDDSTGDVYTAVMGSAPNRQFIVQWHNRPHYNDSPDTGTFQVVFYEGTRKIDFVYDDVYFSNPDWDNGESATIGINQDGSNALQYSFNTPAILTGTSPVSAICFDRVESVTLVKTVGTDSSNCAVADTIDVAPGTKVFYCYEITNDAATTRNFHTLVDSELGMILYDFPFALAPGASVFVTESAIIDLTTTNVATWTVSNTGDTDVLQGVDSATVNALGITCAPDETLTTIFSSDFEADNGGGVGSLDWEWGTVPLTYPVGLGGAHSGNNAWATVLDGPYNNLGANSLLTFTVDLSSIPAPIGLSWFQYLQAGDSGFDFAVINANGTTVYDSSGNLDESDWMYHYANLDAYADSSLTVVFDFHATTVVNDEGWYVDDLAIQYCREPDSISLATTVGLNSSVCAASDAINVSAGTSVYYCYKVTNNGSTSRSSQTLVDSELGMILNNFPYTLSPGASVFVTETAVINTTTINTATWTADNPSPALVASDTATVIVSALSTYLPMIEK